MNMIFDFDGTIMDTYPIMVDAFVDSLVQLKVDDFEIDDYEINQIMRRHSLATCLQKYSAHFNLSESILSEYYRKNESENIVDANLFLNIKQVLTKNIEDGGKNFILTHRDDTAIKLLQKHSIDTLFAEIVTKNHNFKRKPDPESLNYLINSNNLNRENTIMVGDRKLDIDAAHNAGIKGCLFDPDAMINSTGDPEFNFNNYYDLLNSELI